MEFASKDFALKTYKKAKRALQSFVDTDMSQNYEKFKNNLQPNSQTQIFSNYVKRQYKTAQELVQNFLNSGKMSGIIQEIKQQEFYNFLIGQINQEVQIKFQQTQQKKKAFFQFQKNSLKVNHVKDYSLSNFLDDYIWWDNQLLKVTTFNLVFQALNKQQEGQQYIEFFKNWKTEFLEKNTKGIDIQKKRESLSMILEVQNSHMSCLKNFSVLEVQESHTYNNLLDEGFLEENMKQHRLSQLQNIPIPKQVYLEEENINNNIQESCVVGINEENMVKIPKYFNTRSFIMEQQPIKQE